LRLTKFNLPDCDIAIGCGRQAIAALLFIKRHRPEVMTVYIQDPRLDPSKFDLVIAPEHDGCKGPNVQRMIGSPNRVTNAKIIGETLNFADGLSKFPMPRTTLLIGGSSKTHELDQRQGSLCSSRPPAGRQTLLRWLGSALRLTLTMPGYMMAKDQIPISPFWAEQR